jgi:hypothetical protein
MPDKTFIVGVDVHFTYLAVAPSIEAAKLRVKEAAEAQYRHNGKVTIGVAVEQVSAQAHLPSDATGDHEDGEA